LAVSGQEASAHLHDLALEPQGSCHMVYPPASVCPAVCCPEERTDLHRVKSVTVSSGFNFILYLTIFLVSLRLSWLLACVHWLINMPSSSLLISAQLQLFFITVGSTQHKVFLITTGFIPNTFVHTDCRNVHQSCCP